MEAIDQLDEVQARAQAVVDQVSSAQQDLTCPCDGWDVAMLLDKMVTSAELFAVLCRGEKPGPDLNLLFPTPIGRGDPGGAFASGAIRCHDAFVASRLEGEMMGPLGVMVPKRAGINVRMLDCTLNTWDLATAIGVDHGITDDAAAPLLEFARGFFPKVREKTDHVRFAESRDVPTSSVVEELVALSGRSPAWSRGS